MNNTIYITTPCLNASKTIDRTIMSVVTQAGNFSIRYHVQDGGSNDGTWERLLHWRDTLRRLQFPLSCKRVIFTCARESDTGMYDGLVRGFQSMQIPSGAFMTWINADDILFAGALAYISEFENQFSRAEVSWVSGSVALIKNDRLISFFDTPRPWAALKAGLCDGHHWPFHQQEGTFFRRWLWDAIDPMVNIRPMKLAGDWNLWRLFAQHTSLVQSNYPLGAFRIGTDQLSAKHRDKYMSEIDELVPTADRSTVLKELASKGTVLRKRATSKYPDTTILIYEEDITSHVRVQYEKVFGFWPAEKSPVYREQKLILTGKEAPNQPDNQTPRLDTELEWGASYVFAKSGWQFPAVTERRAAELVREFAITPEQTFYIGLPWATIIDKLQSGASDRWEWMEFLYQISDQIPAGCRRVTVCQHVLMKRYLELFRLCGITDIFWSHATRRDVSRGGQDGFTIHPFPLFPVNMAPSGRTEGARRYLFSFIGAKPNSHYLTEVRRWILERLSAEPDGYVAGRDGWHFQRVVYDRQILGESITAPAVTPEGPEQSKSTEFSQLLADSVFSLCPSGSGSNTIRLWESLGSGAIPVILADEWAPPGSAALWNAAVVWCRETPEEVSKLPNRLRCIAANPPLLASMQDACSQLWLLYGPEMFVTDIMHWALRGKVSSASAVSRSPSQLLSLAASRLLSAAEDSVEAAQLFGKVLTNHLLLSNAASADQILKDRFFEAARQRMSKILPQNHSTIDLSERVAKFISRQRSSPRPALRLMRRESKIRVCLLGKHSHRTPLAYDAYRTATLNLIEFVTTPQDADVVITGFAIDLAELAPTLLPAIAARPKLKVLVVSEEPLWDTVWNRPLADKQRSFASADGKIDYTALNHFNSDIFKFDRIPYFVTTTDDYIVRYRALMMAESKVPPECRLKRWSQAAIKVAFFAERRSENEFSPVLDVPDVRGLSQFRTLVAELSDGTGVVRVGQGWGTSVRRQQLPDWHLAKLAALRGNAFLISALENTWQRDYITEKLFDAIAVGSIPVVYAGPNNRLGELISEEACVNLYGMEPEAAAAHITESQPMLEHSRAVGAAASRLSGLFGDYGMVATERDRIARAIVAEIEISLG